MPAGGLEGNPLSHYKVYSLTELLTCLQKLLTSLRKLLTLLQNFACSVTYLFITNFTYPVLVSLQALLTSLQILLTTLLTCLVTKITYRITKITYLVTNLPHYKLTYLVTNLLIALQKSLTPLQNFT